MQDAELFMGLAGIAGVFVGFGALIAVRSSATVDPHEVTYIRVVVWTGFWVVVAAIAPVVVARYEVDGQGAWRICSLVALALFWGLMLRSRHTPEHRLDMAVYPRSVVLEYVLLLAILVVPHTAALVLVALGTFPDLQPALYLTAVALGLVLGGVALLGLVFSQAIAEAAQGA